MIISFDSDGDSDERITVLVNFLLGFEKPKNCIKPKTPKKTNKLVTYTKVYQQNP